MQEAGLARDAGKPAARTRGYRLALEKLSDGNGEVALGNDLKHIVPPNSDAGEGGVTHPRL
jgi:hypothetical protein